MKVFVDKSSCIGCGLCAFTVPEVFAIGDEGTAEVQMEIVSEELGSKVQKAISDCPASAIHEMM